MTRSRSVVVLLLAVLALSVSPTSQTAVGSVPTGEVVSGAPAPHRSANAEVRQVAKKLVRNLNRGNVRAAKRFASKLVIKKLRVNHEKWDVMMSVSDCYVTDPNSEDDYAYVGKQPRACNILIKADDWLYEAIGFAKRHGKWKAIDWQHLV